MTPIDPPRPPRLSLILFRWFCHPAYREEIEGDLMEQFHRNTERFGAARARRLFIWDVLRLFRPEIMVSLSSMTTNNPFMKRTNWLRLLSLNLLFGLFVLMPYLPGPPNKIAVGLAVVGQVTGFFGVLLLPVGLAWAIVERKKRRGAPLSNWNSGFYFAVAAAVIAALLYVLATGILYSMEGWGAVGVAAPAGLLLLGAIVPAIGRLRRRTVPGFNPAPLYLLSIPVVAFVTMFVLVTPVADFSRDLAIRQSRPLIAAIEAYRAGEGRYPENLAELRPAYLADIPRPSVMGVRTFIYQKTADTYTLSFWQHLGETEELVVYNNNNRHRVKGHYASFDARAANWRYYWLD